MKVGTNKGITQKSGSTELSEFPGNVVSNKKLPPTFARVKEDEIFLGNLRKNFHGSVNVFESDPRARAE